MKQIVKKIYDANALTQIRECNWIEVEILFTTKHNWLGKNCQIEKIRKKERKKQIITYTVCEREKERERER